MSLDTEVPKLIIRERLRNSTGEPRLSRFGFWASHNSPFCLTHDMTLTEFLLHSHLSGMNPRKSCILYA